MYQYSIMNFRYVPLEVEDGQKWDIAVQKADSIYEKMMHNICWYSYL